MPNYSNNFGGYSQMPQNMYYPQQQMSMQPSQMPPQQVNPTMIWVDGEIGARSYNIPPTHPTNQPFVLWDTNSNTIYLKKVDAFGRPEPLRKITYTMEPEQEAVSSLPAAPGNYATKDDLDSIREEIHKLSQAMSNNQNNQYRNNKGGNNQ